MKLTGRREFARARGSSMWCIARVVTLALGVLMVSTTTCSSKYTDNVIIYCHDTNNCADYPGTSCNGELCVCPRPGLLWCRGGCWPKETCRFPQKECDTAADCPQPANPRCGEATCEFALCGFNFVPLSKLPSQTPGDCRHLWCDGDGHVVAIDDGSDTYDDGAECTIDVCEAGAATTVPYVNAAVCPETGKGVCHNNACVECISGMVPCSSELACVAGRCVNPDCVNAQWDQALGETAKDCGGPCGPCDDGSACKVNADCLNGVCKSSLCQPPTCSDGVRNGSETDTDCGGPASCPRCPTAQGCKVGSDCESGVCWAGACEPPKCTDGIKNGDEEDWDCGGSCPSCL
jgi:hypothetical protein